MNRKKPESWSLAWEGKRSVPEGPGNEASGDLPHQIVFCIDFDGKVTWWSRSIIAWSLSPPEKPEHAHLDTILHGDHKAADPPEESSCHLLARWPTIREQLEKGETYAYSAFDSHFDRFLRFEFHPLTGLSRTVTDSYTPRAIAVVSDVDVYLKLGQNTAELRAIIETLAGEYWRLSANGTILDFYRGNPQSSFFPFTLEKGDQIDKLLPPEISGRFQEAIRQVLASKETIDLEYRLPNPSGEDIFEVRFVPLLEDQIIMSNRNITEKARLESIAHSVDTMHNFGFIFSGIRHEIGNPINSIKMAVSVLRDGLEKYSKERIGEYIERIMSDINRVEYLLNSLKSFNMFEDLTPRPVSLTQFMGDTISLVRNDFDKRGIEIRIDFDNDQDEVRLDPRALHQVMLNLLSNAADALEGRDKKRITCQVTKKGNKLTITIEDNGCGMNHGQQEQLFRPFFTSKPHGTGLGLVIVRKLLTKMNGSIKIESREETGTRVILTFHRENR